MYAMSKLHQALRIILFAGTVSSLAEVLSAQAPSRSLYPTKLSPSPTLPVDESIARPAPFAFAKATAGAAEVHQEKAALDTSEFLASEAEIRRLFLERHPPSGRAAQVANLPTTTPDQRFDMTVAIVMFSRLVPANQKPPSNFRVRLTAIIGTQTMGTGLERFILGQADESQPDPKSVDKLAKQNMQIFKAMAVQYGGINPAKFDSSPPLVQAQYILSGAKDAAGDILFPCPYTVYMLDEDKLLEEDQPHFARDFFGHLAGRNNEDYSQFDGYNRQQRTQALQRAFVGMIEQGRNLAAAYSPSTLTNFASLFGMSVASPNGVFRFTRSDGKQIEDDALIASIFGLEGQRAFRQVAEGPSKNDFRTAAFLLMCERDAVLSAIMLD